mgnify:CR=1 FL=1
MFECCDVLVGDVDEYGLVERDAIGYRLDIFSGNQPFPVCIDRLDTEKGLSGNIWLVSFKISYLCLPLFYETRTTPSCHPSGCAYRQL